MRWDSRWWPQWVDAGAETTSSPGEFKTSHFKIKVIYSFIEKSQNAEITLVKRQTIRIPSTKCRMWMSRWNKLISRLIVSCDSAYILFTAQGCNHWNPHICPLASYFVLYKSDQIWLSASSFQHKYTYQNIVFMSLKRNMLIVTSTDCEVGFHHLINTFSLSWNRCNFSGNKISSLISKFQLYSQKYFFIVDCWDVRAEIRKLWVPQLKSSWKFLNF